MFPQWHPMLVHFPLALTLAATLFLFGAQLSSSQALGQSLSAAGSWNLFLAAVTIQITLATGLSAAYHLHLTDGAQFSVTWHMIFAITASQFLAFLALWRGFGGNTAGPPGWLFLCLLSIVSVALIATGYFGGENVYHYGLGMKAH